MCNGVRIHTHTCIGYNGCVFDLYVGDNHKLSNDSQEDEKECNCKTWITAETVQVHGISF